MPLGLEKIGQCPVFFLGADTRRRKQFRIDGYRLFHPLQFRPLKTYASAHYRGMMSLAAAGRTETSRAHRSRDPRHHKTLSHRSVANLLVKSSKLRLEMTAFLNRTAGDIPFAEDLSRGLVLHLPHGLFALVVRDWLGGGLRICGCHWSQRNDRDHEQE
jgi:hypothetical protein